MPVKNVKRKTNDGFEGVITGLNDKEKEIISDSVGIEANPADEATETLEKVKIGDVSYNVGGGALSFSALTIPSSELTPSQDDIKKAFFPVSRNAFFDSLFEVKCYQSLNLIYAHNAGFINVPLEVVTIATGAFKALNYAAPSQQLTLQISKNEGDESYFFTTDAEMKEFLTLVESFEFIELK